jgi:di/tricarboxylate transporter
LPYYVLLIILAGAFALLLTNRVPPDGVGLAVVVALLLTGEATVPEAFAGFVHPATLTVAAVLVLSSGVQRTGLVDGLALWMRRHARTSERRLLHYQTALTSGLSTVFSNTATVAVFLPVVLSVTRDRGFSPARFLIPLSFATILGGMCTLIGTSTNVVVASLVEDHGLSPIHMFDFAPVGLACLFMGYAYLVFGVPRLIPSREGVPDLTESYHLRRYLTEVEILHGSHLAGRTLEESQLSELYDLDVLEIHRRGNALGAFPNTALEEKDILLVRAGLETIRRVQDAEGVQLRSESKHNLDDLEAGGMHLAEAVVPPGSSLENRTLKDVNFRTRHGVTALALFHHREYIRERVGRVPLHTGDVLLLYGSRTRLRELAASPEFLSVVKYLPPRPRRRLGRIAALVVSLTLLAAILGVASLVKVMVVGAAMMVITGCLTLGETYRALDRKTLFLLAAMISLGLALERSGAAQDAARAIMGWAGGMGPIVLLAATYLLTTALTELVTNNACAVIMTPIAIAASRGLGLDPHPFAMAVAYSASASFLTPFGYQTNMFVYGPGGYRFSDFFKVGLPLTLICFTASMLLIPRLWPLVAAP